MSKKNELIRCFFDTDSIKIKNKEYKLKINYADENNIAFQLANTKHLNIEKDFTPLKIDSYPSLFVFINNDPLIQRIAIQIDTKAFNSTKLVATVLSVAINNYLKQNSLRFVLKREIKEIEFWDIVAKYNNNITKVTFNISYPNLPRIESNITKDLKNLSKIVGSQNNSITLSSQNGLALSDDNEDIKGLNKASSDSGSPVVFNIKGEGTKKTGHTAVSKEIDSDANDIETGKIDIISMIKSLFS